MQDPFFASGFLYSLKTHQILLLQSAESDTERSLWSMLGGEGKAGEESHETFRRVVQEILNLKLKPKNIYPVYDYFHDTIGKMHFVFYAEVKSLPKFTTSKKDLVWVSFPDTVKFLFSAHAKQDVLVGERVINLKWRESQASL